MRVKLFGSFQPVLTPSLPVFLSTADLWSFGKPNLRNAELGLATVLAWIDSYLLYIFVSSWVDCGGKDGDSMVYRN